MSIYKVELSNSIEKLLKRNVLPEYILIKLYAWISSIEKVGLAEVRKLKG